MDRRSSRIMAVVIAVIFLVSLTLVIVDRYGLPEGFMTGNTEKKTEYPIVDGNTVFSYLTMGQSPENGNEWTRKGFDATNWKTGTGELGNVAFVRTEFNYNNEPNEPNRIMGSLSYKDAVIVYLNGHIIYAGNVVDGGYDTNLEDGAARELEMPETVQIDISDISSLKRGKNVLAFEIHRHDNDNTTSFVCNDLNLVCSEREDDVIDITGAVISAGQKEDEVKVSWISEDDAYYRLIYAKTNGEKIKEEKLEKANSLLMERHDLDEGKYINTVTLSNLGRNQKYVYVISKVGSDTLSKVEYFTITGNANQTFYVVSKDFESKDFDKAIEEDAKLLIPGQPGNRTDKYMKRHISIATSNETSDSCYIYNDMLIITVNRDYDDIEAHRQYIENIVSGSGRKWLVVMMEPSLFEDGNILKESEKEEWFSMLKEQNVNAVITGENSYRTENIDGIKIFNAGGKTEAEATEELAVGKIVVGFDKLDIQTMAH